MKKIVLVAVVLGVVSALGLGATLAFAQGPTPTAPGWGPGWMHGSLGLNAEWRTQMQAAVAKALGVTLDELNAQLSAGKTIAQIAQDKKTDLAKLHDDVQAAHKAIIQQAVKDGTLRVTQAQADWTLQRIDAMDKYFDANGGTCPGLAAGAGFGAGMMGGAFGPGTGFRSGMMGHGFWTQSTTK